MRNSKVMVESAIFGIELDAVYVDTLGFGEDMLAGATLPPTMHAAMGATESR